MRIIPLLEVNGEGSKTKSEIFITFLLMSICYKILIAAMVITAWICAITGHTGVISSEFIGWIIILTILALTVIRTIIFSIMDVRGI